MPIPPQNKTTFIVHPYLSTAQRNYDTTVNGNRSLDDKEVLFRGIRSVFNHTVRAHRGGVEGDLASEAPANSCDPERTATLDLTLVGGVDTEVTWYDPPSGSHAPVGETPQADGLLDIETPGPNADGSPDWVILARER